MKSSSTTRCRGAISRSFFSGTFSLLLALALGSCRHDDVVYLPEPQPVTPPESAAGLRGFYLLNEGNMGSNKSTLDFYDFETGTYTSNIYAAVNPEVPKELGDVGNDLQVYGSKLYAVINCSNKVEVMDAQTARRLGQVDIPNCRSVRFEGGYAYVTSYAGPVQISPTYEQRGYVAKVDTATLEVVDRCLVGFQPDGLAIRDGKIYVANSGGYMVPNYENTLSVIDLESFTETGRIEIAINLSGVVADGQGRLWVASRGDYYTDESNIYCYDIAEGRVVKTMNVRAGTMALDDGLLYVVGTQFSYLDMATRAASCVIDTRTLEVVRESIVTDGTESAIRIPYGVAVNPESKEVYITDAGNYVNPGWLYCYSPEGVKQWRVRTGDIPAHFAFIKSLK